MRRFSGASNRGLVKCCAALLLLLSVAGPLFAAAIPDAPTPQSDTASRIQGLRVFEEPVISTGPASSGEDDELWSLLDDYDRAGNAEALEPLLGFLEDHPDSPWSLSLRTNLGLIYYRLGYFSLAIENWEQGWRAGKEQTDPAHRAIAQRAFGELIRMHARLGHADRVAALLAEVEGRALGGPATEAVAGARAICER
jgi:hypothetical protein